MAFEDKEEEIQDRELTTPTVKLPDFKAYIPEEDIENLDGRDKKMLLAMSMVVQKVDWSANVMVEENRYIRELEREVIKLRRWRQKMMQKLSIYSGVFIAAAGLLSVPTGWFFKWLWAIMTSQKIP